jgi:hypothetical protein
VEVKKKAIFLSSFRIEKCREILFRPVHLSELRTVLNLVVSSGKTCAPLSEAL